LSGGQQQAEDRTALLETELSADPELLQTLLSVFRDLDLSEQIRTLLTRAETWTQADCGFALMAGDDPDTWVPMVATLTRSDRRYRAVGRFDPTELRERVGEGVVVYPGLGPLDVALNRWPDPLPGATLCLPVRDTDGDWGGLLLLMLDSEPAQEQTQRLRRLLELCAPAVRHALQLRAMRELVIKDDTAQCYNRRYFEERLPEELARADRFRAPLSLIFLDMDNLKRVSHVDRGVDSNSLQDPEVRQTVSLWRRRILYRLTRDRMGGGDGSRGARTGGDLVQAVFGRADERRRNPDERIVGYRRVPIARPEPPRTGSTGRPGDAEDQAGHEKLHWCGRSVRGARWKLIRTSPNKYAS
jgi:hypothetical protein